jgi:hypothetical protein
MNDETVKSENDSTDTDTKEVTSLPDLQSVNHDEATDLFEVLIRRDTNFLKEGSNSEFNVDEDFEQFSAVCHGYTYANTNGLSQLVTINYETKDEGLVKAASLMTSTIYANLVKYNKDGTVKESEIIKVVLLGMYPTFSGENYTVNKMFIFAVDSTFK